MKLTDKRIDQVVTAFADSKTPITPDLAQDLSQVSENYTATKIIELYNARIGQSSDRLGAQNIADKIWTEARKDKSLRVGSAFPVVQTLQHLSASEGYSGEEYASGFNYLADKKGWVKNEEPFLITEEGFKNL